MKLLDKYTEIVGDIAVAVDDNKYLAAIKDTFTVYMPFVIVGSFSTLLNVLLSSTTTGLAQFKMFSWLASLAPAFTALNFATMNIMALSIPVILGSILARKSKVNEIYAAIVALASYIAVVPQSITTVVDGVESLVSGLPVASTNASGLFIGIFTTILFVGLFAKLTTMEKLKIKMPPSVPGGIVNSFNLLVPILITIVGASILGTVFRNITGLYLNEFIYQILQAPLEAAVQSPIGIIILIVVSQIFWVVGIHGGLVVTPIRNPLLIAALAANIEAVAAGGTATNPVTLGFWTVFIAAGGAGYTLSLIIATLLFSKKEENKAISKLAFIPGIFGISEPIVFGLPLVLNPVYALPFVFTSAINTGIALFFMNIGFMTPNVVDVPFGLPLFINAFIGWGWKGAVVQLILLVVGVLLYIPFVLADNRIKENN